MLSLYLAMIDSEEHKITFERIYQKYGWQMYYAANDILEDSFAAEDAVQEALMGIARYIANVPTQCEAVTKAYVLTVARNAAWKMLKTEAQWKSYIKPDLLPISGKEDVFEQVSQSEDYQMLLELIQKLPDPYKDVLFLRYVADLKPQQIGDMLNRKTATVQQQLFRAKMMLGEAYEKRRMEDED